MDRYSQYRQQLLQMPAGLGSQPEQLSFWDKLVNQFRAQAAPAGSPSPKIDPDKAKAFIRGFTGQ